MHRTALCDLLQIDYPIVLAAMGSATSASFAAVVSNAGGLGSIATLGRPTAAIRQDLDEILELADRVAVMSGGTINYVAAIEDTDRNTIGQHMAGHH